MLNRRKKWVRAVMLLEFILMVGCTRPAALPDFSPLQTKVEQLYLNYYELRVIYSDLRNVGRLQIGQPGEQLSEIQTAARFIDQANLIAYYQWELLSITEYIHEDARSDFFTLRAKDIVDARQKSQDLILAIKVYDAFIHDPAALALIAKGIEHIEQNVATFGALYDLMLPLANRPEKPPTAGEQESL
jgi:hypothetical protein